MLNKIDLVAPEEREALIAGFRRRLRTKAPLFAISAAAGEGCRELSTEIARFLQTRKVRGERSPGAAGDPAMDAAGDLA